MRIRLYLLILALMFSISACNLSSGTVSTPIGGTSQAGAPSVQIISPQDGTEVVVNTQVVISVAATDSVGITRAQLYTDGDLVQTVSSQSSGGDANFVASLNFTPRATGSVEIEVIAYRGSIASTPARIRLSVTDSPTQPSPTLFIIPFTNVPIVTPNDPTCRIITQTNVNERTGPDTVYPVVRVLGTGTALPIVGRIGTNQWWQVRDGGVFGWVSASFVQVLGAPGNCAIIPVVPTPPPPATATPSSMTATPTVTPSPTLTLAPSLTAGLPDLVIASIVGSTNVTLGAGNTPVSVSYSVTISNTGQGATGQFANTIQLQPGGVEQPLGVVSGLNPSETILLQANVQFTAAGTFTITARADTSSAVTEFSEVNNTGILQVVVNNAP